METQKYFKTIINKTSSSVVMLYWSPFGNASIEKQIVIKPNQEVSIPDDNSLDQFKITSRNFLYDLFKFTHEFNTAHKKRIFVYDDKLNVQDNDGCITFSKK